MKLHPEDIPAGLRLDVSFAPPDDPLFDPGPWAEEMAQYAGAKKGLSVLGSGGAALLASLSPDGATTVAQVSRAIIGGLTGLAVALACVFIFNLLCAPYRQRNEARALIRNKSSSPLTFMCDRYEHFLLGADVLRGTEYLWRITATITNTSDTLSVSTSHVWMLLHRKFPDSTVRVFRERLAQKADLERVRHDPERILDENEYLLPRQSKTGYYYFIDNDMNGLLPTGLNTWPHLHIIDSFGVSHLKEFRPLSFA